MGLLDPNRWRGVILAALVLVLALASACSRQTGAQTVEPDADQQLPFAQTSDKSGVTPTGSLIPTEVPAGTPITVLLQAGVSSATSQSGDSFEAVLGEPIILQGQAVLQRGAAVSGRVVDAKASGRLPDAGYLRLTLTTISIHGNILPVQCSSIFVKGGPHEKRTLAMAGVGAGAVPAAGSQDVGFSAEQRLTFRLEQPLPLQR